MAANEEPTGSTVPLSESPTGPPSDPGAIRPEGTVVGRDRITGIFGAGGMGVV